MPNTTRGIRVASPVAAPASPSTDLKRRRFLFTLSVGGAGAAAAAIAAMPAAAAVTQDAEDAAASGVAYRETEHVRDYYRTTKL